MIKRKKMISLLLVLTLVSGMFVQTYATEIDDTKKKAEELESKKKAAENEKTSLADQLKKLTGEMEETKKKISAKEDEITNKEEELILAKADENEQYESMKKRIRYMYENGNTGFVEILCSSKSIGELLNNAEYISRISGYDRNMLVEFQKVVTNVENQEAELKKEYKELQTMQDNLITKQDSVNELIKNKQSEIQSLTSELGDTKNKLAQLEAAAAEVERKQKEAAAAAAAAKKAQAAAKKEYKLIGVFGPVPPGHRWCREMEHLHILVRVDIFRVDLVTEHSRLQVQVRIIKGLTLQQQQERQSMRLRQEQLFQPDMPEMRKPVSNQSWKRIAYILYALQCDLCECGTESQQRSECCSGWNYRKFNQTTSAFSGNVEWNTGKSGKLSVRNKQIIV